MNTLDLKKLKGLAVVTTLATYSNDGKYKRLIVTTCIGTDKPHHTYNVVTNDDYLWPYSLEKAVDMYNDIKI